LELARSGLREAAERAADVRVDACPRMREGCDVEGDSHGAGGTYEKRVKWIPRTRVSGFAPCVTTAGTAVGRTSKRTTQVPPCAASGTRSVRGRAGSTWATTRWPPER